MIITISIMAISCIMFITMIRIISTKGPRGVHPLRRLRGDPKRSCCLKDITTRRAKA